MTVPVLRLDCQHCGVFMGYLPFPVLATGVVHRAPHPSVGDDGKPIYLHCAKCKRCSRWEILPPAVADDLLTRAKDALSSPAPQHQEAA